MIQTLTLQFTINVGPGITFTSPPPPANVGTGQTYTHTFTVGGIAPPFTWTKTLPAWLTLTPNADGSSAVLQGTAPATQGPASVSLSVSGGTP
jgi:hypothetical protein